MNSSRWKRQLWTDQTGCKSDSWFFFLSCFQYVGENWLCKRGRKARTQTQPVGSSVSPFLRVAFLWGFKVPSPSQVGPQPHSQEGECATVVLHVNRLPKGAQREGQRPQARVCSQLQAKPQPGLSAEPRSPVLFTTNCRSWFSSPKLDFSS